MAAAGKSLNLEVPAWWGAEKRPPEGKMYVADLAPWLTNPRTHKVASLSGPEKRLPCLGWALRSQSGAHPASSAAIRRARASAVLELSGFERGALEQFQPDLHPLDIAPNRELRVLRELASLVALDGLLVGFLRLGGVARSGSRGHEFAIV